MQRENRWMLHEHKLYLQLDDLISVVPAVE
jgi:hypothetical protein